MENIKINIFYYLYQEVLKQLGKKSTFLLHLKP